MWREGKDAKRPEGGFEGTSFMVTPAMMSILGATHEDMNEILSTLGYRADIKSEEFVKNRLALIDPSTVEPEIEQTVEPTANTSSSEPTAEEAASKNSEVDNAGDAKTDEVKVSTGEEDKIVEEKTVSIWRPAKQYKGDQNARSHKKPTGEHQAKQGKGRDDSRNRPDRKNSRNAGKSSAQRHKPRPEKVMDPDSPFAKLAALKASLETKK